MNHPMLTIAYATSAEIPRYRIVCLQAEEIKLAWPKSFYLGVSTITGGSPGEHVDVHRMGIVPVEYGGNIAPGDRLTSDDTGRAVKAVAGDFIIGVAEEDGVEGDIGSLFLVQDTSIV